MKSELPSYWTGQLIAIILLFSLGLACFPVGLLMDKIRPVYGIQEWYPYNGPFEANLSASTPTANVSLGICYKIEIEADVSNFSLVTIRILNMTNDAIFIVPPLVDGNQSGAVTIQLERDYEEPHTMEVEWEGQPLLFQCHIIAYAIIIPLPCVNPFAILYVFWLWWLFGFILIIQGTALAIHFVVRTKSW